MKTTIQKHQKHNLKIGMKTFKNIGLTLIASLSIMSCSSDDTNAVPFELLPPSPSEFAAIRKNALDNLTQHFTVTAGTGVVTLTSDKGVTITIDTDCLTKNGVAATGIVDIDFVELFDKGSMLTTNKPTMGLLPNGDKNMLISGGEFFIEATQNGVALETGCNINLTVPSGLTGGIDNTMTFWEGITTDEENLVWDEVEFGAGPQGGGMVGFEGTNYQVTFGNFGWSNVDRFYNDPRPKTSLLASVPNGYDNNNCAIYLSYDGEGGDNLAKLDTYNPTTKKFSEHYGQLPIGLQCHVIFATEESGQWRYAIKAVTVAAGDEYNFTLSETTIGTEAQLVAAINALP
jgi:hypothetical protein